MNWRSAGVVALRLLLLVVFSWVWIPAAVVFAVVFFARYGWDLASDLFAVL